jgi:hypothetical protein
VFARDPDAQLDLIELPVSDDMRKQQTDRAICDEIIADGWAERANEKYREEWSQDDLIVASRLIPLVENNLNEWALPNFRKTIQKIRDREEHKTAWQIDATLREFPGFDPINIWFEYPVHRIDEVGVLKDVKPEAAKPMHERGQAVRKEQAADKRVKNHDKFVVAFGNLEMSGEPVLLEALADAMQVKIKTLGDSWLGKKDTYGLASEFESYQGEKGRYFVRRKQPKTDAIVCD